MHLHMHFSMHQIVPGRVGDWGQLWGHPWAPVLLIWPHGALPAARAWFWIATLGFWWPTLLMHAPCCFFLHCKWHMLTHLEMPKKSYTGLNLCL